LVCRRETLGFDKRPPLHKSGGRGGVKRKKDLLSPKEAGPPEKEKKEGATPYGDSFLSVTMKKRKSMACQTMNGGNLQRKGKE